MNPSHLVLFAMFPLCAFSQSARKLDQEKEIQRRIAELNDEITRENRTTSPAEKQFAIKASPELHEASEREVARRFSTMDYLTSQVHGQVDEYITAAVDPAHVDPKAVERGLQQIIGPMCDTPPSAFILDTPTGRSLIVVYALQKGVLMGPQGTSATVRAYNVRNGGMQLADATGTDMNGYGNVSVRQLPAPPSGGKWLLVWGQMTGANGPNIRMRAYAYDGAKFRTMWMPENSWGAFTIDVTEQGFTVDGLYYRESGERHDRYFVADDGLYRQAPICAEFTAPRPGGRGNPTAAFR
ncbi:MAG TPA: hypothetical protein DEQ47_09990 [Solibacterales bacterium]|nr:hypothetical protein [Bryobacterales bacterium]